MISSTNNWFVTSKHILALARCLHLFLTISGGLLGQKCKEEVQLFLLQKTAAQQMRVEVAKEVPGRLQPSPEGPPTIYFLVGWEEEHTVFVVSSFLAVPDGSAQFYDVLLPGGLEFVGIGYASLAAEVDLKLIDQYKRIRPSAKIVMRCKRNENGEFDLKGSYQCNEWNEISAISMDSDASKLLSQFKKERLLLRTSLSFQNAQEITAIETENVAWFNKTFNRLINAQEATQTWSMNDNEAHNSIGDPIVLELYSVVSSNPSESFKMTMKIERDMEDSTPAAAAKACDFDIEVLFYVKTAQKMRDSLNVFLRKIRDVTFSMKKMNAELPFPVAKAPKLYIFEPAYLGIPIVLPFVRDMKNDDEQTFRSWRVEYHKHLGLPLDKPALKLKYSIGLERKTEKQEDENLYKGRLSDVHIGIPRQNVQNGVLYLVKGHYDYYHYRQDGINDEGWGCAYRSLQTICSYLQKNSLADRMPPTHREIQQTLVDLKDKKPSFVGSSQWIGAIELSLVLDQLYGIQCKIIRVNSGPEIYYNSRELATHFDTEGTPIMIGGGVLAYTLLGIDWNAQTGDVRYLILDPHYTGKDDLQTIQKSKKWIWWYKADLFRKDSFYNFLLPQRPKDI